MVWKCVYLHLNISEIQNINENSNEKSYSFERKKKKKVIHLRRQGSEEEVIQTSYRLLFAQYGLDKDVKQTLN